MRDERTLRRAGYLILCTVPLLLGPLTGSRALRVPVVHEVLGVLLFGTIAVSGWWLARPAFKSRDDLASSLRVAAALLLTPTTLIALLSGGAGNSLGRHAG